MFCVLNQVVHIGKVWDSLVTGTIYFSQEQTAHICVQIITISKQTFWRESPSLSSWLHCSDGIAYDQFTKQRSWCVHIHPLNHTHSHTHTHTHTTTALHTHTHTQKQKHTHTHTKHTYTHTHTRTNTHTHTHTHKATVSDGRPPDLCFYFKRGSSYFL